MFKSNVKRQMKWIKIATKTKQKQTNTMKINEYESEKI